MPSTIGRFAALFLPAAIIVGLTCGLSYRSEEAHIVGQIVDQSSESLRLARVQFINRIALLASDARYLARCHALDSYLANPTERSREDLESDWIAFAESRGIYDQVRLLDEAGQEQARINFAESKAARVPRSELQNKADRYYFKDSMALEPGAVYVSRIDLNIEHGQIERPLKPMMRVGTSVADRSGAKRGVVVLNYLGQDILSRLERTGRGRLWWVDADGYWLRGPSPETDWGFMFGKHDHTIRAAYPGAWSRMHAADSGQFEDSSGIWIFDTIHVLDAVDKGGIQPGSVPSLAPDSWFLVAHISRASLSGALAQSRLFYSAITAILLGLIFAGAYRTARAMSVESAARRSLESMNQLLEQRVADRTQALASEVEIRRNSEQMLAHQASHDVLTGLANRDAAERWFAERVNQGAADSRLALVFIDVDDFKLVNDHLGHANGDALLKFLAKRCAHNVREGDLLARYGGDEFLLLLSLSDRPASLESALDRLLGLFDDPIHLEEFEIKVSASMGVARFPEDAPDWEHLLKAADTALYEAKRVGKGRLHFYSAELAEALKGRFELTTELRAAIAEGGIEVFFQPKITGAGALTGFEALARWHSPSLGPVPPDRFIAVAEETGMIIELGRHILHRACEEAARWQKETGQALTVAVNLSPRQLRDELLGEVQDALAKTALPPSCLELEVTENLLMQHMERTVAILANLRAMGVSIVVDDFGTGYSSLAYLRDLPIDGLKIDRSFVTDCQLEGQHMAIPHAVIFLGRTLKLRIVAEGVELASQFDVLRRCGCDEFQGYWISRPIPAEPARTFIAEGFRPDDWPGDGYL